jgi:hypothetical protein
MMEDWSRSAKYDVTDENTNQDGSCIIVIPSRKRNMNRKIIENQFFSGLAISSAIANFSQWIIA